MKNHVYSYSYIFIHVKKLFPNHVFFIKKCGYMFSINETYVFMNFDLVVVQVYKDL